MAYNSEFKKTDNGKIVYVNKPEPKKDTTKKAQKLETILLTASSNVGIGLWTSICVAFASIFGTQSVNLQRKNNKVLNQIKTRLMEQMISYPEYEFEDFRITKERKLSFIGTVEGKLKNN